MEFNEDGIIQYDAYPIFFFFVKIKNIILCCFYVLFSYLFLFCYNMRVTDTILRIQ